MAAARILIAALALAFAATAAAQGSIPPNNITCSVSSGLAVSCFYERIGWHFLGLEGAAGARFEGDLGEQSFSLAPYTTLSYYSGDLSWWVELRVPEGIVPTIGQSDFLVAGASISW